MDDVNKTEGPITATLFDTALLSVFNLFERFREYGKTADPSEKAFADTFSDPDLLLNYLKAASTDSDTNGDDSVERIWEWAESKDNIRGSVVILLVADAIIAYATQAMRAETDGDLANGWKYVGEARYWEGILNGIRVRKLLNPGDAEAAIESEKAAVLMANSRHAETAALREEVVAYYHANVDPEWSVARAAEYITEKRIVPLKFRTIQGYVSAEKKRLAPK